MNKLKVSIIIPVYNGSNYLQEAIDSALAQTYKNIEVIVVDDGSTDGTKSICKLYGTKIRYFFKQNGGVSTALNFGIKKMKGEYFSWLSHDDKYATTKIETQINLIKSTNANIAFCNNYKINSSGKIIGKSNLNSLVSKISDNQIATFMFYSNLLTGCSLLINKTLFEKYGFFDTKYRYTQDYRKWLQFLNEKFVFDNHYGVYIRYHDSQDSKNYLYQSNEMDLLWLHAIKIMQDKNTWDLFLGKEETLYYFFLRFKNHKEFMSKTLEYIAQESSQHGNHHVIKKILCYFPQMAIYLKKRHFFKYIIWYWKQNGIKLFCSRIIQVIFKK